VVRAIARLACGEFWVSSFWGLVEQCIIFKSFNDCNQKVMGGKYLDAERFQLFYVRKVLVYILYDLRFLYILILLPYTKIEGGSQ
jgi:hypothetical protein